MEDNRCQACHEALKMLGKAMNRAPREDEVEAARLRAVRTGSHEDLKTWLGLRRRALE